MLQEAVEWLAKHPDIKKPGIGVVGVSMGAEFAMYMPIVSRKVGDKIVQEFKPLLVKRFCQGGNPQYTLCLIVGDCKCAYQWFLLLCYI